MNQLIINISKGICPPKSKRLILASNLEKMIPLFLEDKGKQLTRFVDYIVRNKSIQMNEEIKKMAIELMPMFEHMVRNTDNRLKYLSENGEPYTILDNLVKNCFGTGPGTS